MIVEAEQLKEIMEKLSGIVLRPPSISEEIQENASRYISSNSTIERKVQINLELPQCVKSTLYLKSSIVAF